MKYYKDMSTLELCQEAQRLLDDVRTVAAGSADQDKGESSLTRWELAMVLLAADEQGHTSRDEGNDVEVYFEGGAKWRCRWEPLKAGAKTMGLIVWPIELTKTGNYRIEMAVYVPASAIVALSFVVRRIVS